MIQISSPNSGCRLGCTILLVLILGIIIACIIWYFTSRRSISPFTPVAPPSKQFSTKDVDKFRYKTAQNKYMALVNELGPPTDIVNKPYGIAIWRDVYIFDYVMLMDESVRHNEPEAHCDSLHTGITVYIPPESLDAVYSLTNSTNYDRLKSQLNVRCNTLQSNVLTLYLSLKVGEDPNNLSKYKAEFDYLMFNMSNDVYLKLYNELAVLITENRVKYRDELMAVNQSC